MKDIKEFINETYNTGAAMTASACLKYIIKALTANGFTKCAYDMNGEITGEGTRTFMVNGSLKNGSLAVMTDTHEFSLNPWCRDTYDTIYNSYGVPKGALKTGSGKDDPEKDDVDPEKMTFTGPAEPGTLHNVSYGGCITKLNSDLRRMGLKELVPAKCGVPEERG